MSKGERGIPRIDKLMQFREQKQEGKITDTGKMLPHFQRCGFPLQKPPADYLSHVRHDGDLKISITAHPEFGMPYGADVLTLLWCFSAAVDQNNRTIRFRFGADMLRQMGLPLQTRNYRMIARSIERIFGATYFFDWGVRAPKRKLSALKRYSLIEGIRLWFEDDDKQTPLEGDDFHNTITLSDFAWEWLRSCPRIETAPAYSMRKMPGAIQLYLLIADRGPRLRGPGDMADIPLTGNDGLDKQIGGVTYPADSQRRWRQLLRKWLAQIRVGWPECPAGLVDFTDTPYGKSTGRRGWYLRVGWCEKKPVDYSDS